MEDIKKMFEDYNKDIIKHQRDFNGLLVDLLNKTSALLRNREAILNRLYDLEQKIKVPKVDYAAWFERINDKIKRGEKLEPEESDFHAHFRDKYGRE